MLGVLGESGRLLGALEPYRAPKRWSLDVIALLIQFASDFGLDVELIFAYFEHERKLSGIQKSATAPRAYGVPEVSPSGVPPPLYFFFPQISPSPQTLPSLGGRILTARYGLTPPDPLPRPFQTYKNQYFRYPDL